MADFNPPNYKKGDPWTAKDAEAIVDELKQLGKVRGSKGIVARRSGGGLQIAAVAEATRYLAVANGAITKRSGTTPGTGSCDLKLIVGSTPTITDLGVTVPVLNPSITAMGSGNGIDSGQYCWVEKDTAGNWIVTPLECS